MIPINGKGKRVLIYSEVSKLNVNQSNVHWSMVFKDGKFQDRVILRGYANQLNFFDALINIGAKPGDNLTKDTSGKYAEGEILDIRTTWPGLSKELTLDQIFYDQTGKGFQIKFGGNRKAAPKTPSCYHHRLPVISPCKLSINLVVIFQL